MLISVQMIISGLRLMQSYLKIDCFSFCWKKNKKQRRPGSLIQDSSRSVNYQDTREFVHLENIVIRDVILL